MIRIHVRDIEMAYDEAGSGAPVVLLHGFPFNRSMWNEQIAALAPSFRVIAPDLRGHGETTVTKAPATMDELARDVVALMDALGISRAAVCGLSMGGYAALALCKMFPARVRALVFADTRAHADTQEAKDNREQQAQKALSEGMTAIADAMLPKLLSPATLARRSEVVERVREMIVNTNPQGAASAQRGMAQRFDHTASLSRILSPTLIIVGSEDAITPVTDAETMHREIDGSRLEVIEGAGHVSNIEQPDSFNRALTTFLGDLEG